MSSAHRNLGRLPLEVFTDVQFDQMTDAASLRECLCGKFKRNKNDPITTVGAFLKLPCETLVRILDPILTYEECVTLRYRICSLCTPQPVSVRTLLLRRPHQPSPLSTGMPALDTCLKGGFRLQTISEIVGSAGVGKTQFAMQLCVEAAKKGFGTIYIDTEKKLNLDRLREIATLRATGARADERQGDEGFLYNVELPAQQLRDGYKHQSDVLNNITVHKPSTTTELLLIARTIEEEILLRNEEALTSDSKFPVHLLIVDSIAAPLQRDFGGGGSLTAQRSAMLMEIASEFKKLADQLQLYVIVINQVASSNSTTVRAAMGNSWHHCLSSRIVLEHKIPSDPMRRATLVKSNVAGNASIYYQITMKGVEDCIGTFVNQ
ncbi:Pfam:KaiC [Fragilaria crotonensis]|nr:Pfam:KaiC [Fragilaria crotonensis]